VNFEAKPVPLWDLRSRVKYARKMCSDVSDWRKPLVWIAAFLLGPLR
jgi:hypothetical protein